MNLLIKAVFVLPFVDFSYGWKLQAWMQCGAADCYSKRNEDAWADGEDPVIACRPRKSTMDWYRGNNSKTTQDLRCVAWKDLPEELWSELPELAAFGSLDEFLEAAESSVDELHDHCRNPSGMAYGPWCIVRDGDSESYEAQPCFPPCKEYSVDENNRKMCFAKRFFPYLTGGAIDPELLDLSPGGVHKTFRSESISTQRKSCFSTGQRAQIFGPWTYSNGRAKVDGIAHFKSERAGIRAPWISCFIACEDTAITCWPARLSTPAAQIPYFGIRNKASDGAQCLNYMDAFSLIRERADSKSNQSTNSSSILVSDVVKFIIRMDNAALMTGIDRLDMSTCVNLAYYNPNVPNTDEFNAYKSGPGCFVKRSGIDGQTLLDWANCFPLCDCSRHVNTPKFKYQQCPQPTESGKDWLPCENGNIIEGVDDDVSGSNARDGRVLFKTPPRAHKSRWKWPLILGAVVAATFLLVFSTYVLLLKIC